MQITQIIIILIVLSGIVLLVKNTIFYKKKPIECKCIKHSTIIKYDKGVKTKSKVCETCNKTTIIIWEKKRFILTVC